MELLLYDCHYYPLFPKGKFPNIQILPESELPIWLSDPFEESEPTYFDIKSLRRSSDADVRGLPQPKMDGIPFHDPSHLIMGNQQYEGVKKTSVKSAEIKTKGARPFQKC